MCFGWFLFHFLHIRSRALLQHYFMVTYSLGGRPICLPLFILLLLTLLGSPMVSWWQPDSPLLVKPSYHYSRKLSIPSLLNATRCAIFLQHFLLPYLSPCPPSILITYLYSLVTSLFTLLPVIFQYSIMLNGENNNLTLPTPYNGQLSQPGGTENSVKLLPYFFVAPWFSKQNRSPSPNPLLAVFRSFCHFFTVLFFFQKQGYFLKKSVSLACILVFN